MTAIAQSREARDHVGRGRYSLWTGDAGVAVYLRNCLTAVPRFPQSMLLSQQHVSIGFWPCKNLPAGPFLAVFAGRAAVHCVAGGSVPAYFLLGTNEPSEHVG